MENCQFPLLCNFSMRFYIDEIGEGYAVKDLMYWEVCIFARGRARHAYALSLKSQSEGQSGLKRIFKISAISVPQRGMQTNFYAAVKIVQWDYRKRKTKKTGVPFIVSFPFCLLSKKDFFKISTASNNSLLNKQSWPKEVVIFPTKYRVCVPKYSIWGLSLWQALHYW